MKKKIWALLSIILFLSFCEKTPKTLYSDLIAEFPLLKKISPAITIRPIETWEKNYNLYGWRRNRNSEKSAVLIPRTKRKAYFRLDFLNKKDKKIIITLKPLLSPGKNTPFLNIFLNEKEIYASAFNWEGFRSISVSTEEEILYIGENFLEFRLSPANLEVKDDFWLALREIRIEEDTPLVGTHPAQEQFKLIIQKSIFSKKRAIQQALNTSLDYCFKIPERAKLAFSFSLRTPNPDALSGEKLLVYLETASGDSQILYEKDFEKGFSKKKIPVKIDISAYQGQISKISFVFLKDSLDRNFSARLFLWEPRILSEKKKTPVEEVGGPELGLKKPFNILIYLVDCLRPDHLPFFNYQENLAPNMEQFSKDSIIFKNAFAQGSWTRLSVGALFTGLYPFAHRSITLKSGLADELTTLAEVLKKSGYHTIAISSNAGVKPYFNFNQGFEFFKYHSNLSGGISDKLNEYAISELKKKKTPFFLYMHTMDLHRPYKLKKEFYPYFPKKITNHKRQLIPIERKTKREFYPSLLNGTSDKNRRLVPVIRKGEVKYTVDLEEVISLYDAAIRQNDKSFGDLMKELKRLGLYENTMIILMADHGDEFYEHGDFAHGKTLYQEVLHQLLVIKLPGQLNAGRIIQENVQTIDIFPTFLDLIGESIPSYLSGKSLINFLLSPSGFELPLHDEIFVETGYELILKAIIAGHWKLIHKAKKWSVNPNEYKLFNLRNDPHEKNDLFLRNPIASDYLKRRLKSWALSQEKLAKLVKGDVEKTLTDKDIEELKALGYIE